MSSLSSALNAGGVMAATIGAFTGAIGIVGVIVTTPSLCPESIAPASCRTAASKAAGLATQGVIVAGVAGLMIAGSRVIDSEA
tara:strand:- start:709 stop:957 length:249 start_codon:yes stop_codon:yes gene_type:complete